MPWSNYQEAIFDFVQNGKGNGIVEAVAGSGKTTTIVEALNRVPKLHYSIFLAFNKAIAEELKARKVNAKTFHSLTFGSVKEHLGGQMDADKLRKLVQRNFSQDDAFVYGPFCCKLVGFAKGSGVGCLLPDTEATYIDICAYHDFEPENEKADFSKAITLTQELLRLNNESFDFDFDDMLYMPIMFDLSLPKFDFIFVDEAQDTNAIQRAILKKLFKKTTRMVAVGDPAQAIYGFRGADSDALDLIQRDFQAHRMPLSVSYRCGQNIVKYARNWVKHIEAAPNAIEAEVIHHGDEWDHTIFQPNDLVVCRVTKPIIQQAFRLLKQRIPAYVMGREIGQGLNAIIAKQKATSIEDLIGKLDMWREKQISKEMAKQVPNDDKMQRVHDQADCILCLTEDCNSVNDLYAAIESLFSDKMDAVRFATIHKSKGLEAKRVFWLNRSACPSRWARTAWQVKQEDNLCYVATTRASHELHIIEETV